MNTDMWRTHIGLYNLHKMKYFIIYIITLLNVLVSFSQNKIIVVDSLNRNPIPFAKVSFGNNNGVYTDSNGFFEIKKTENDTIVLTHSSFNKCSISINEIKDTIILTPCEIILKEINVSNNKKVIKYIDFPKKNGDFGSWPVSPKSEIISLLIPSGENINSIIKNFTLGFVKRKEKEANIVTQTAIRINIYSADRNQNVSELIFSSEVFKINPNKKEKFELDVENEYIEFVENGIFIGLEVIGDIDTSNNIIKEKSYVHVNLTSNTIQDYESKSFIKYTFNDQLNLIPINDIIKKTSGKNVQRSMSFGLTIIK